MTLSIVQPHPLTETDFRHAVERGFERLDPDVAARLDVILERAEVVPFRHWYRGEKPAPKGDVLEWIERKGMVFDETGVVQVVEGQQRHYHPLRIAAQTQRVYGSMLQRDGDERRRSAKQFLVLGDWFRRHGQERGDVSVWPYEFPFRDLEPGWISCLSQAAATDVLLKQGELGDAPQMRDLARRAARVFVTDERDGGVATRDASGAAWLQEYAGSVKLRDVLNGFMSSVLILINNRSALDDVIPPAAIDGWLETIRGALPEYTRARTVKYSRRGGRTPVNYYPQMIRQLRLLGVHDGGEVWEVFAQRWEGIAERGGSVWRRLWR